MPLFQYKAITEEGIAIAGMEDAPSADDAARQLGERSLIPIDINQKVKRPGLFDRLGIGKRISASQQSRVYGHIASLLEAGIPLTSSLDLVAEQMDHRYLAQTLGGISRGVERGKTLADSAGSSPDLFPSVFTGLIRAGEESGKLPEIFERMVVYVEREAEMKRKITEAMTYPIIVVIIATVVTSLLLVFMVPRFVGILESTGVPLPLPTRALIGFSGILRHYGLYGLGGLIAFSIALSRLRHYRLVKYWIDRAALAVPLIGSLVRKAAVARFTKTMSTLLGSGVPILPALGLVGPTFGNSVLERANDRVRDAIDGGENFTSSLRREGAFPSLVVEMVSVGESTGSLDRMLEKIGNLYDKEVERATKKMTLILEPALIVGLGVMVGFVALALILPMLKAVTTLGS